MEEFYDRHLHSFDCSWYTKVEKCTGFSFVVGLCRRRFFFFSPGDDVFETKDFFLKKRNSRSDFFYNGQS
jgi:hypothetical protein